MASQVKTEFHTVPDVQFPIYRLNVIFHGLPANVEDLGYLLIGKTGGSQGRQFELSVRQVLHRVSRLYVPELKGHRIFEVVRISEQEIFLAWIHSTRVHCAEHVR